MGLVEIRVIRGVDSDQQDKIAEQENEKSGSRAAPFETGDRMRVGQEAACSVLSKPRKNAQNDRSGQPVRA
jgi:hypothetical protein